MKPVSIHDYLLSPSKYPAQPVCVIFGDDPFLISLAAQCVRNQVLAAEDAEFSLCRFEGSAITFKDAYRELQTVAMFGGGRRIICIEEADSFVTKFRGDLEKYVIQPSGQAILLLQLKAFASNTNLYKKVAESGLIIESKALTEKELLRWVVQWAKHQHKVTCELSAAGLIVERIGTEPGLINQELAKLVLLADGKKEITTELVEQSVGAWRTRTAFDMLDLALDGKTAAAIHQLDLLLASGENAIGILAPIASNLRKMAAATELFLAAERQNRRITVRSALEKAGFYSKFIDQTEKQFIKLGRHRGAKLSQWLLELDLDLKGNSRTDPRILLERFIVNISAPELKVPKNM